MCKDGKVGFRFFYYGLLIVNDIFQGKNPDCSMQDVVEVMQFTNTG